MIETKYGLKYSFPHSLVHIVDNSAYTGDLPVVVAEDPSLFSTIVVTGAPMGEDNRVITVTRSDVLNVGYGLGNITSEDLNRYGQSVEYPTSLINQNVPVRLMRVTPEGSTYGVSCVLVQWRVDEIDKTMHVRFKLKDLGATNLAMDKFKNSKRLIEAIQNNLIIPKSETSNGYIWNQRVFMINVSAGRGKVYNYMATAINSTSQAKRPPNVKYEFVTIDTRTDQICERFEASLVNINNANRMDAIPTVNTTVGRRVEGSSIIIPHVNESAVKEVYNDYIRHFKNMLEMDPSDESIKNIYSTMNINIFDMIYGNYIYNGTEVDTKLPFYQVDMLDSNVPSLPETNRIGIINNNFDENAPLELYNRFASLTTGVTRDGDNVYVGDMYLNAESAGNPSLSIVATINQYSGVVTSLIIPKIHPLKKVEGDTSYSIDNTKSVPITTVFNDTTKGTGSLILNNLVSKGQVKVGDIVAMVSTNSFVLYTVTETTPDATTGDKYTLSAPYTKNQMYQALDWSSHPSGSDGTGNLIGRNDTSYAYKRLGATVIDDDGNVWVNDYTYSYDADADFSKGRIQITNNSAKFGKVPSDINITTDNVGSTYDILVYDKKDLSSWKVADVSVTTAGSGYSVNDIISPAIGEATGSTTDGTLLTVTKVNSTGGVLEVAITQNNPLTDDISVITDEKSQPVAISTNVVKSNNETTGSGCEIAVNRTVNTFDNNPTDIYRYVVTGVQGSLFRIQRDTSVSIPSNYYSDEFGICPTSENGGIRISGGSTGFFDDDEMNPIEFKWRYSALLVKAFRGQIDPRIMSPTRVPAKFLFDGAFNTLVGQTLLPNVAYAPADIISGSTIFTEDEKEEVLLYPDRISSIRFEDIDVKQAMYDFMVYRCYMGIPDDKRPIGPGSGLSLFLDSGVVDMNTTMLIKKSFAKRFDNPNASWDIGGWTDSSNGYTYTYTKQILDNLFTHSRKYTINKPFVNKYSVISADRYTSFFPEIDTIDWEQRESAYTSGGNIWIMEPNGDIIRHSQRTLGRMSSSSDFIQESNMRTLSQLVYLAQNKINSYLIEYDDDDVLKTLNDELNNMFSPWIGKLVNALTIKLVRDVNIDGGDIVICYINVTFRGLILRVPIIVNVQRRQS